MHNPIPIKVAMVKQGINGEQLAALAHVSRPTITRITNGKAVMPQKLEAVVQALGLSMAEVYEQAEPAAA